MNGSSEPVAVLGATGTVGAAVVDALREHGCEPIQVRAPRVRADMSRRSDVLDVAPDSSLVSKLAERLSAVPVVVNAAGLAAALGVDQSALTEANAMLPLLLLRACAKAGVARLVHVSSSAVQGNGVLDESKRIAPFSAYSASKALGEQFLLGNTDLAGPRPEVICFRPTSVQAADRPVTRSLVRFARSPLASVAGLGTGATPQVLLGNVADAIAFTTLYPGALPDVVLQPWEGLTCTKLLQLLGEREPAHLPEGAARAALSVFKAVERRHGFLPGVRRRLEMMWWGQRQQPGWLDFQGWRPVVGEEGWRALGANLAEEELA